MKVVAVCSTKGGVGKTIVALTDLLDAVTVTGQLRGDFPTNLLRDMFTEREKVKKIFERIHALLFKYYEESCRIIKDHKCSREWLFNMGWTLEREKTSRTSMRLHSLSFTSNVPRIHLSISPRGMQILRSDNLAFRWSLRTATFRLSTQHRRARRYTMDSGRGKPRLRRRMLDSPL